MDSGFLLVTFKFLFIDFLGRNGRPALQHVRCANKNGSRKMSSILLRYKRKLNYFNMFNSRGRLDCISAIVAFRNPIVISAQENGPIGWGRNVIDGKRILNPSYGGKILLLIAKPTLSK